jgi:hypothetical protein
MDSWNGRCLAVLALFSNCFKEKGKGDGLEYSWGTTVEVRMF